MKQNRAICILILIYLLISFGCEKPENTLYPSNDFIVKGSWTGDYWPTEGWRFCKPEEVGMDSEKLKELNDEILLLLRLHIDIHSVIIVKDGYIIAEQYYNKDFSADSLHSVYSCTKSLTSALIGIAIDQGFITSKNVLMTDFFTDYKIENLSFEKQNITLEHMLTMSAGLEWYEMEYPYNDDRNTFAMWGKSPDRVQFVLNRPMVSSPGEEYCYNTGLSHLLSAIIQKSTGIRADSFARKNIFTPLGIEKYYWPIDPQGVAYGGNGVQLMPRDMAKFGYLYLKNGIWEGIQLIPQNWVQLSQQKLIEKKYTPDYYYGYHWWVSNENYYSAVGFGGQWIIIVPEDDLVVVFTNNFSDGDDFQWSTAERLLKTYILPAVN